MKQFSAKGRKLNRATAKNAALLNLLATPGLGSLMGRRRFAGSGQLILSITGFMLFMFWFAEEMIQFYGQISGNVEVRPVGKYLVAGLILFAAAWVWSAVTSLGLMREAASQETQSLEKFNIPPPMKASESNINTALAALPQWKREGEIISRTFKFADFPAAMKFVNAVAELAEQAQHHPDIDVRWNKVTLALSTHDAGGLTEKDFALARQFDRL